MVTRRQLLASGSLSVVGLAGCLAGAEESLDLENVEFELVNNTDESLFFHYAFEKTDGVDEWYSPRVPARDAEWIDPDSRPASAVAIHVVVDDTPYRGDLTAYDDRGYIALEYRSSEGPELNGFTGENAPETPLRPRNRENGTGDDDSN